MSENIKVISIRNATNNQYEEKNIGVDANRVDYNGSTLNLELQNMNSTLTGHTQSINDNTSRITIVDNKIELYNDGEKIEDNLITDIFLKYKKGIKGNFGLGLSIVKKSLELYDYKISVINKDKGVLFKID